MGKRLGIVKRFIAFLLSASIAGLVFLVLLSRLLVGEYEVWIPASVLNLMLWGLYYLLFPWAISKWGNASSPSFWFFCAVTVGYGIVSVAVIYMLGSGWKPYGTDLIIIGLLSGIASGLVSGPIYWIINYKSRN